MTASIELRLRAAADALTGERVPLSHLAAVHGPAAQGTLLVLLAAPCLLPMPGVGSVLGIGLALLALTMWRGQQATGLPKRVADVHLSDAWARRVLGLLADFYGLAGRWARSRLTGIAEPGPRSWIAAKAGLMAVLIVLPIPFGNVLPALALMLLGLGLVFRDGAAVLLSAAIATTAVLYTGGLGMAAWLWGMAPLLHWLQA
jgi:hypothetical protein